nr:PHD and RING finger domain-containing protein 1-like [Aedes albopictus]
MSLPGEKDAAASPSSCVACDRPDSDENMVACDGCECWYHFSCADVDESVSGQPWKCESCGIMNQTPIPTKNIRKANGKEGGKRLTVPTGAKKSSKVSVSSKGTSRRSKKSAAGDDVSLTSSARARLALELRMLDEDEQIKEQELQAELELKNKKLMLQKQNRERELALEAKQLAEEKAFQERQLEEEEKGRKALLQMKRLSLEAKKNIVRQFSQRGSDVSSLSESEKSSEAKVRSWLQKSGEQTEGIVRSTSAARGSSHVPEITGKVVLDEIRNPISGAAKKVNYLFEEIPGTTEGDKNDGDSVCNVQQQAFNDEIGPTSHCQSELAL